MMRKDLILLLFYVLLTGGCASEKSVDQLRERVSTAEKRVEEVIDVNLVADQKIHASLEGLQTRVESVADATISAHEQSVQRLGLLETSVNEHEAILMKHEETLSLTGLHEAREKYLRDGSSPRVYTKAELDALLTNSYAKKADLATSEGILMGINANVTSINEGIREINDRISKIERTIHDMEDQLKQCATLEEIERAFSSAANTISSRFPDGVTREEFEQLLQPLRQQVAEINRLNRAELLKVYASPPPGYSPSVGNIVGRRPVHWKSRPNVRGCGIINVWQP